MLNSLHVYCEKLRFLISRIISFYVRERERNGQINGLEHHDMDQFHSNVKFREILSHLKKNHV